MDICSKQRAAIDFCVRLGKDINETCALMHVAYREECFWLFLSQKRFLRDQRFESTQQVVTAVRKCLENHRHYFEKQPTLLLESDDEWRVWAHHSSD